MTTPTTGATATRRAFALGLAGLLASRLAPGAAAKPVSPRSSMPSIKTRAGDLADACGAVGGTATTTVRPGGTTVSCTGGGGPVGESTCVVTSKGGRCYH